jgi:hypothetical protein
LAPKQHITSRSSGHVQRWPSKFVSISPPLILAFEGCAALGSSQ